jgi:hypothetical protein
VAEDSISDLDRIASDLIDLLRQFRSGPAPGCPECGAGITPSGSSVVTDQVICERGIRGVFRGAGSVCATALPDQGIGVDEATVERLLESVLVANSLLPAPEPLGAWTYVADGASRCAITTGPVCSLVLKGNFHVGETCAQQPPVDTTGQAWTAASP